MRSFDGASQYPCEWPVAALSATRQAAVNSRTPMAARRPAIASAVLHGAPMPVRPSIFLSGLAARNDPGNS